VRAGSEEYLDSEKYQLRPRDWAGAEAEGRTLAPFITQLNDIRRRHPAFAELSNIHFHHSNNDWILAYSKATSPSPGLPPGPHDDVVLVVVNLDPHYPHDDVLGLDLPALGFDWGDTYEAHDELTGATYTWTGPNPYVRLDPDLPAHVLHLRHLGWA